MLIGENGLYPYSCCCFDKIMDETRHHSQSHNDDEDSLYPVVGPSSSSCSLPKMLQWWVLFRRDFSDLGCSFPLSSDQKRVDEEAKAITRASQANWYQSKDLLD